MRGVEGGPLEWREDIAANIRAERARRGLDQADVIDRMRCLGFTQWHRQTLGDIERVERRVQAEEIVGLAVALEVDVMTILGRVGEP